MTTLVTSLKLSEKRILKTDKKQKLTVYPEMVICRHIDEGSFFMSGKIEKRKAIFSKREAQDYYFTHELEAGGIVSKIQDYDGIHNCHSDRDFVGVIMPDFTVETRYERILEMSYLYIKGKIKNGTFRYGIEGNSIDSMLEHHDNEWERKRIELSKNPRLISTFNDINSLISPDILQSLVVKVEARLASLS